MLPSAALACDDRVAQASTGGPVSQPPATWVSAVVFTVKVSALAGSGQDEHQGEAEQHGALHEFRHLPVRLDGPGSYTKTRPRCFNW